jgi:hypothetical protein
VLKKSHKKKTRGAKKREEKGAPKKIEQKKEKELKKNQKCLHPFVPSVLVLSCIVACFNYVQD